MIESLFAEMVYPDHYTLTMKRQLTMAATRLIVEGVTHSGFAEEYERWLAWHSDGRSCFVKKMLERDRETLMDQLRLREAHPRWIEGRDH